MIKLMLFELDEPEMIKVEEIVLPSKGKHRGCRGRNGQKNDLHFPARMGRYFWKVDHKYCTGRDFTAGDITAGNWDVLRPAAEIEEMNTFTADGLNALLHEAEEIMEGWTEIDE